MTKNTSCAVSLYVLQNHNKDFLFQLDHLKRSAINISHGNTMRWRSQQYNDVSTRKLVVLSGVTVLVTKSPCYQYCRREGGDIVSTGGILSVHWRIFSIVNGLVSLPSTILNILTVLMIRYSSAMFELIGYQDFVLRSG